LHSFRPAYILTKFQQRSSQDVHKPFSKLRTDASCGRERFASELGQLQKILTFGIDELSCQHWPSHTSRDEISKQGGMKLYTCLY